MRKYTLLLMLFLASFSVAAQENFLRSFSAFQLNNKAVLKWTIKGGNTCLGTKIYRSTDSIDFVQIGEITGICGNSNVDESYIFTDSFPEINAVNYYKLEFGGINDAAFLKIDIVHTGDEYYLLSPNPAIHDITILVQNEQREKISYIIYDIKGIPVLEGENFSHRIHLTRDNLQPGIYIFILSRENKADITGKFILH